MQGSREPCTPATPPKQYNLSMVESSSCPPPSIEQLRLEQIFNSPHQMRKHFDPATLRDLANSMKVEGLIQPITVRKVGNAYELVVGERRLRAAQMLGWPTIDARVIDISDEDAAIKGLIETSSALISLLLKKRADTSSSWSLPII